MPLVGSVRPPAAGSVLELVRRQPPDAVAVEAAGVLTTYGQLGARAAALAGALHDAGVGPGDLVALPADRTVDTIAAALAVMTRRAAYVPIDPAHPAGRTDAVLAAARPVLTLRPGEVGPGRGPEPLVPRPDDAAYVIFTSGSTGPPKGVVVEHGSLVNYAGWVAGTIGAGGSGSPLFGSLGFDLVLTALWPALISGSRVVLHQGTWDPAVFAPRPRPYGLVKLTPSQLRFFERTGRPDLRARAEALVLGGEPLDPALLTGVRDRLPRRLVNHYGPTETTVGCCAYLFEQVPDLPTVPIGRPIWNTRAYVVDESLRPATEGELVIAGAGVARGYLGGGPGGFVDDPDLGGRAYRTGDQVELLPSGDLLHRGRRDGQRKVNGHRVELGELRRHALAVPGVTDVGFDVVRGPSGLDVVEAYVVGADPDLAGQVRRALAAAVPGPVVPRTVHVVAELVVDANGKCDVAATRRALTG